MTRDFRSGTLLLLGVLVMAAFVSLARPAVAQEEPFLEFDVTQGAPGLGFDVRGSGHNACLGSGGKVFLFFDSSVIGESEVEPDGSFTASVTLPTTIEDPEFGTQHTVSSACTADAPDDQRLTFRTLPADSGSVQFEASLMVFTESGPNRGVPGERANAVGTFEPPPCPQGEGLPPHIGRVFIFFDGTQVAEAAGHPDPPGFSGGIFDIPQGASPGEHTVSVSCEASGQPARVQGPFTVLGSTQSSGTADRSLFISYVPDPRDAFNDGAQMLKNLLFALLVLLLVFPSQLFNSTLEEHYDEIRGWLPLGRKQEVAKEAPGTGRRWGAFVAFAFVGSLIYGFLDPEFGPANLRMSLILLAGMFLAIVVTTLGFAVLPGALFKRSRSSEGYLRVLPATIIVALVCVVISRLTGFLPGYFYGLVAGFVIAREMSRQESGRNTLLAAVITLVVAISAWLVWIPIRGLTTQPGAGLPLLILEAVLVATFVAGLEALVFGMIPMRFLPGEKIFSWNKPAWVLIFFIGAFGFVQVIVRANASDVPPPNSMWTTVALFLGFGLVSVLFWGFFRFRGDRPVANPPATDQVADAKPMAAEAEGSEPKLAEPQMESIVSEPDSVAKKAATKPAPRKKKPTTKTAASKKKPSSKAKRSTRQKPGP